MSTSQGLSKVRPSSSGHGPPASARPEPQHSPPTRSRQKRFEVGIFIRKIVKGWLAYCKKLPAASRGHFFQALSAPAPDTSEEGTDSEFAVGGIQPLSGTGKGDDDGGPVGQTSLEAGIFLSSTTETTDEESDSS